MELETKITWISVKDSLPPKRKRVLFFCEKDKYIPVGETWYVGKKYGWAWQGIEITHWAYYNKP